MACQTSFEDSYLLPSNIKIDARTVEDHIGFIVDYSKFINFYNKNNEVCGNWSGFVLKDPIILCAYIGQESNRLVCSEYINLTNRLVADVQLLSTHNTLDNNSEVRIPIIFYRLVKIVEKTISDIIEWGDFLDFTDKEFPFKDFYTYKIKTELSEQIKEFIYILKYLSIKWPNEVSIDISAVINNCKEWLLNLNVKVKQETKSLEHNSGVVEQLNNWVNSLNSVFNMVCSLYLETNNHAKASYKDMLNHSNCYPDTALIITFLKMLEPYKNQLNDIAGKHLDYYYKDVLKQNKRKAISDKVYALIKPKKNVSRLSVPINTEFIAGQYPNGQPIIFCNSKNEVLSNANIKKAHCVNYIFYKNEIDKVEKGIVFKSDLSGLAGKVDKHVESINGVPIFGTHNALVVSQGFILSSPMFSLNGGERKVSIEICVDNDDAAAVFEGSQVFVSTKNGWYIIGEISWSDPLAKSSKSSKSKNNIKLEFNLDQNEPAVCFSEEISEVKGSIWPSVKILLGPLKNLRTSHIVESFDIKVEVKEASVRFSNDFGLLKNKGLSMPFGSLPDINSHLYVDLYEAYIKPLTSLTLNIDWSTVPSDFSDYYSAYNATIDNVDLHFRNGCFQVSGSALVRGDWNNLSFIQQDSTTTKSTLLTPVFQENASGKSVSTFSFDLSSQNEFYFQTLTEPDLKLTKPGWFRLTLETPVNGFGHAMYADVMSTVTIENSKLLYLDPAAKVQGKPDLKTLPNPPYVPNSESLSAHYCAEVSINVLKIKQSEDFKLYHCDQFSTYKVFDTEAINSSNVSTLRSQEKNMAVVELFPIIKYEGELFLALDNAIPCSEINIFFQLSDWGTQTSNSTSSKIEFNYLTQSGWRSLKVLSDFTRNFTCSGSIKLFLPQDAIYSKDKFGDDLYRISLGCKKIEPSMGRLLYLDTQAVLLVRKDPDKVEIGSRPYIEKNKILAMKKKLEGLDKVIQPYCSFLGQPSDTKKSYYKRVSQRIKSKDRASSCEDFESLAFGVNSDLYYADCQVGQSDPTNLKLLLVSANSSTGLNNLMPSLVSSQALEEIRLYLLERSSGFISLDVFNMKHQAVKVSAKVVFKNELDAIEQCKVISEKISKFLSPWIAHNEKSMFIEIGLKRADIIKIIGSDSQVLEVLTVDILKECKATGLFKSVGSESVVQSDNSETILVSVLEHDIQMSSQIIPSGSSEASLA